MLLSVAPLAAIMTLAWMSPGLIWAWLAYPAPDRLPRLAIGSALGLALQIDLAAPLANTVGITRTSVIISTALSMALAIALGLAMRVRTVRLPGNAAARRRETRWFIALAMASVAICALPLAFQIVPDGWDPSFHSLLASVTIATGKLPTWSPYEPIASNYPYGSHIALAEISLLTGLQPDQVFGALLNVVVPALAALQIYALARRMWRTGPAALGAVAAYSLLGYFNSVDYGAWGGLPNALGMILVLASLEALFAPGFTWRRIFVAGAILSAMPLTHHHVALSAGIVFGVYIVALLLIVWLRRPAGLRAPQVARREAWRALRRLAAVTVVALLLAAYAFVPFVARGLRTLGNTSIFTDLHEYSGLPFDKNGDVLWLMATLGASLALWYLWRATSAGSSRVEHARRVLLRLYPRRGSGQAQLFSAVALVSLFAAFIFGHFIFHDIVWALYHKDESALTPTRFLSNMTYFLALYAGPGLAWLWSLSPRFGARETMARRGAWLRGAIRAGLVIMTLAVAVESLFASNQLGADPVGKLRPGDLAAYQWIRTHTSPDTLVIATTSDARWAPYLTRREAAYTPLPTSEDSAGYPAQKQLLVNWALLATSAQPRLSALAVASAGPATSVLAQRPLAIVTSAPATAFGTPAYSAGPARVYLAPSLLALLATARQPEVSLWWRDRSAGAPAANWMTPGATTSGWIPGAQAVSGPSDAGWLRMTLALPAGAAILCQAQDGATLSLDGVVVPGGCSGALTALPQQALGTGRTGPRLIAIRITQAKHPQPWLAVMVLAATTSAAP